MARALSLAHCTERGLSTVGDKRYRWGKWISPKIGHKPIAKVSRDDIEDIRNALDDAIREVRLSWKTASNVWGELSVSFGEAIRRGDQFEAARAAGALGRPDDRRAAA